MVQLCPGSRAQLSAGQACWGHQAAAETLRLRFSARVQVSGLCSHRPGNTGWSVRPGACVQLETFETYLRSNGNSWRNVFCSSFSLKLQIVDFWFWKRFLACAHFFYWQRRGSVGQLQFLGLAGWVLGLHNVCVLIVAKIWNVYHLLDKALLFCMLYLSPLKIFLKNICKRSWVQQCYGDNWLFKLFAESWGDVCFVLKTEAEWRAPDKKRSKLLLVWALRSTGVSGHLRLTPFPFSCSVCEPGRSKTLAAQLQFGGRSGCVGWPGSRTGAPSWEFASPPCPWKHSGASLSAGGLLKWLAALLLDQAFVENCASLVQ